MHPARLAAMQVAKATEQAEQMAAMDEKLDLIMAHLGIEAPDHEESDPKDSTEGDEEGGELPDGPSPSKKAATTTETKRARHRKA